MSDPKKWIGKPYDHLAMGALPPTFRSGIIQELPRPEPKAVPFQGSSGLLTIEETGRAVEALKQYAQTVSDSQCKYRFPNGVRTTILKIGQLYTLKTTLANGDRLSDRCSLSKQELFTDLMDLAEMSLSRGEGNFEIDDTRRLPRR